MGAGAEAARLAEDERRERNWKRWGPYLAERQWGTVREDYSPGGTAWDYLPHDHARSRAYRWGEDGLLGWTDRECRLCLAPALWNGRDPILKERLFGLTNPEGNHGEDVKECYYYLDAVPTHATMRALYKYPQREFPYARLVEENRRRGRAEREFELEDAGAFEEGRYFDLFVEYAKASPDDILLRLTAVNRGPEPAALELLPQLWFRNTWAWGRTPESGAGRPALSRAGNGVVRAQHPTLGAFLWRAAPGPDGRPPELLFTENETNAARLFGAANASAWVKDAFHEYVVGGRAEAVSPLGRGTKAAARYRLTLAPGAEAVVRLRLAPEAESAGEPFGPGFDAVLAARRREADEFHAALTPPGLDPAAAAAARQARAGLLWSKQFYHYAVAEWAEGDPAQPPPPPERAGARNAGWEHVHAREVLSMPDKWEYPWFAAWDHAFQAAAMARLDPAFAKKQLVLLAREWYMHPSGQLPAYEYAFGDVNPPVHAWAAWRVYREEAAAGRRDRVFLERVFQKLVMNFTWWVNREDPQGRNVFAGGFLGLDNIGVFDRSHPLPGCGSLEQADGTAWMAFFCVTMLAMALELARESPAYGDMASKFLEHFLAIAEAMNTLGGSGLWDEADGFYYDRLLLDAREVELKVRSAVGLIPLLAVEVLDDELLERRPGFTKRMRWLLEHRRPSEGCTACLEPAAGAAAGKRLLAIPSRARLERVLRTLLDEAEFLSPYGVRSLSRVHLARPYSLALDGGPHEVRYMPGESESGLFGGNSNWRGPVWFPMNVLLIEALERYHRFYGDGLLVELPTGSGRRVTLAEAARELSARLARLFLPDASGRRPCHGGAPRYARDPAWKDLVLFYEHFHGDDGRGLGASHQTGWTAWAAACLEGLAR